MQKSFHGWVSGAHESPQAVVCMAAHRRENEADGYWSPYEADHGILMRAHLSVLPCLLSFLVAGCNTPPIPQGKPVDIPTALEQVMEGLCNFKKNQAAQKQDWGVAIDSLTVELELTVDGTKNPPVAVAPDVQFIPTVSYGQMITAIRGSRISVTLKNTGVSSVDLNCSASKAVK